MSYLNGRPFIYLESRNGDGYPKTPHSSRSFQEGTKLPPQEPCLKTAYLRGAEIHQANSTALAAKLKELYKLSTETPKETNELFLKSFRNTLQENILSFKELSEFSQNSKTAMTMLNKEKSAFLNNLKHAHSLGLLEVIPDQQKESDIKSSIFTSGEIKLHHSIDPSYLVSSRDRSKLYFMIINKGNSPLSSEPVLRIFSDEGDHRNPFHHLNVEFTDTLRQNKTIINSLFRNKNHGTASNINSEQFNRLEDSNNPEIRQQLDEESQNEHNRVFKLFQAENNILEYLFEHQLGKAASARDNLNLLKSINELISAQKTKPIARSGQIESGGAFDGRPFYLDKLYNTSKKPLEFFTGFISTENLKIQFLFFDSKEKESTPKLNLKLTDEIRGHSKLLLLDSTEVPKLANGFKERLNDLLSFIQTKESKQMDPNLPTLKRPNPPKP